MEEEKVKGQCDCSKPRKEKAALPLKGDRSQGLVFQILEASNHCSELQILRSLCRSPNTSSVRSGIPNHQCDRPFGSRTLERHATKRSEVPRPVSSKTDRCIDGEQQMEKSRTINKSQGNFARNGGWHSSRVPHTSPSSPTDCVGDEVKAHFRDGKTSCLLISSRDWVDYSFGHESPWRPAKNVVERFSQSRIGQKTSQKELKHEVLLPVEEVYGGFLSKCLDSNPNTVAQTSYSSDEPYEPVKKSRGEDYTYFQNPLYGDYCEDFISKEGEEEVVIDLQRRSKEAKERFMLLSKELEQESFLKNSDFDVPSLVQTIRTFAEERVRLALEVSSCLHSRIADRAFLKKKLRFAGMEFESQTRRVEKEKNKLQYALERELDRRSSDWSNKLEKSQFEVQRLRECARELAEHNVSLQREVSSFHDKDAEHKSKITYFEQQLKDASKRAEDMNEANQELKRNLSELLENYRAADEDRVTLQKNFATKEKECKELHKTITRLLRTCTDQNKTIDGLREAFAEELGKAQSMEMCDKLVAKLQMEQMRLTGVELAWRKELESFRLEVGSLQHENIDLQYLLKGTEKESEGLTVRLDKEMWTPVCCLQNQGLAMLNDSSKLCSELLDFIKGKACRISGAKQESEVIKLGLDGHFIGESEMKVQGLRLGIENLTRSLQTVSVLLHDKSNLAASISQSNSMDANGTTQSNPPMPEDVMKYELKVETLLTSLLREKLYSKEQEVEQLQAEISTVVRGVDILKCEVQNAMDSLSFVTQRLKDLELQDENLNTLQTDLEESRGERFDVGGGEEI